MNEGIRIHEKFIFNNPLCYLPLLLIHIFFLNLSRQFNKIKEKESKKKVFMLFIFIRFPSLPAHILRDGNLFYVNDLHFLNVCASLPCIIFVLSLSICMSLKPFHKVT